MSLSIRKTGALLTGGLAIVGSISLTMVLSLPDSFVANCLFAFGVTVLSCCIPLSIGTVVCMCKEKQAEQTVIHNNQRAESNIYSASPVVPQNHELNNNI